MPPHSRSSAFLFDHTAPGQHGAHHATVPPCPFCGSHLITFTSADPANACGFCWRRTGEGWAGICMQCLAIGPEAASHDEAVQAWNQRHVREEAASS